MPNDDVVSEILEIVHEIARIIDHVDMLATKLARDRPSDQRLQIIAKKVRAWRDAS
jgi:hypothetical protein